MNLRLSLQSAIPGRLLPRLRTAMAIVAMLGVCILAPASDAFAGTVWTVNDQGDSGTTTCGVGICQLRDALNHAASSGDTIAFSPGLNGQTIALISGELAITDKSVAIVGNGANLLTISGQNLSRVFNIQDSTAASMVVSISGLTLTNGAAGFDNDGGALLISRPVGLNSLSVNLDSLTIQNSTAGTTANNTYSQGGGIFSQRANLRITNSTISGNTAFGPSANGGGLVATGSDGSGGNNNTLVIINSTITGNTATDPASASVPTGGGVELAFGTATILNATIDNNTAFRAANFHNGNASTTGFPLVIYNSIISNANGTDVTGPNITGPISDAEYDLFDNDASATYTGTKTAVTTGANPNLGTLASNGGPTQTQKPPLGSPEINAGNPAGCKDDVGAALTTDQRGSLRPDPGNRCDLGAYELSNLILSPTGPALPDAVAGIAYSTTISASGGVVPYTYSLTSGSLGPFSLNAATGAITGNTTVPQALNFTISAIDQFGNTGSRAYTLRVDGGPAIQLVVSGFLSPTTAGTAHTFTVTAKDSLGNIANVYTGTVHFTSSDAQAALPADYTFVAGDSGVHTFSATLKTAGTQSLTATDTVTPSITGTQTGIVVNPGAAVTLAVRGYPSPVNAGTSNAFTVTAMDSSGNTATSYAGTVHFTSSDTQAVLPADYTYVAGDSGAHAFNATFKTAGTQSLTATDTVTATITGAQTGILITQISTTSLATNCMTTFVENQPFTMTATVSGAAPTGTVNFATQANVVVCGNVTLNSGSAPCTTSALSVVGSATEQAYSLTASYGGDAGNTPSTSAAIVVTVLNAGDVIFRNGFELDLPSCPIE